ncbi:hypothetical protein BJ170DRAFT_682881 [Xylariales sp. AK1849]|nr:hypothetical protein BJ170DRAFT_682881 [Xylariales sp. AK1849]
MALSQKKQEAIREHLQGIPPPSRFQLLNESKSKPFDLTDNGIEPLQISLHDRPVIVELTLVPAEEWLLRHIPKMASEGIILLYDTADRDGYEALKAVHGKVFGAVKKPSEVQATRSWRLARQKVQPQPARPVFLVAISLPWQESTDKVTHEQGEELCEVLGGTFVELTAKRYPVPRNSSKTNKKLLCDLASRIILRRLSQLN